MIQEYELDEEYIKKNWKNKGDQEAVKKYLCTLEEFKRYPVYAISVEMFACCFKGHSNSDGENLNMIDNGYALTADSIEKLLDKYKDDPRNILVGANLMSMDYEKYYKNGHFVDLDGNEKYDFFDIDNFEELMKKAEIEDNFIHYVIWDIDKDFFGKPFV